MSDRIWRYKTWGGKRCTVVGHLIEFGSAHVVFRDSDGRVILAESVADVHELSEVNGGSSTRGVRPKEAADERR